MTEEAPTSIAPPSVSGGGDLLVVDDFPDSLALYEALLTDDGHRVRTARSGKEALSRVDEREPELVLLDVSMPGMGGVEVLQRLRTRRRGGPAVVMLTAARREAEAVEAGLREGADAYLTKPIESRELLARVRVALESFRLRRMLEDQRRDHVAMLVHDLRHPLSSLGLIAELLDGDDLEPAERRSAVETMRALCTDMARLIDGVLAASRLEAGVFAVERRQASVKTVIDPTIVSFSNIAARRRIALKFSGDLDVPLSADVAKLRQALDNIISNALKFTPRSGKVVVFVERRGKDVVFEIGDSGPGVPLAEREAVFDRYRQGKRGRAAGGSGLGLAIARGIAEAHGGSLTVSDSPLGGALFVLRVGSE